VFECPFQVFISGGVHELIDGSQEWIKFRRLLIVLLASGGRKLIFSRKEGRPTKV